MDINEKSVHTVLSESDEQQDISEGYEESLSYFLPDPMVWKKIMEEAEEGRRTYKQIKDHYSTSHPEVPKTDSAMEYLDREVFPILLPVLETMLFKARDLDLLRVQKSRFNGVDYIVEQIWNQNPLHEERADCWIPLFKIPFVKERLEEHPRPYYPLSWLWSKEEAALIIQSSVRAFLVRCRVDVQEMRQFWKTLKREQEEEKESLAAEALNLAQESRKEREQDVVDLLHETLLEVVSSHENELAQKDLKVQSELKNVQPFSESFNDLDNYIREALEVEQSYNTLQNINEEQQDDIN